MLIPIGPVKNIPVTILRVSHDPPSVIDASIIYFDGKAYQVALRSDGREFDPGEQVLVDFGEGSAGRRRTRVKTISPAVLTLELLGRPRRRERRDFPRIEGEVDLEYRVLRPDERPQLEAWLQHPHLTDADKPWVRPDPFMDFSVTGLKFRSATALDAGTLLCLRFRLPGLSTRVFTCGGEMVRAEPEEDGTYSLAVSFIGLPDETADALMEYTRHCQDMLLGIDTLHEE